MKRIRIYFSLIIILIIIGTSFIFYYSFLPKDQTYNHPENDGLTDNPSIILLIGDGMGFSHIELGRIVEYGINGNSSLFEFPYSTNISTLNYYGEITDSAAAATAIATGYKTANQRISYSINNTELKTILEYAEEYDFNTGIVVSSDLRHATPAVFAAHNISRNNNEDLSRDMADHEIEILFGGGLSEDLFGQQIDYMINKYNYKFIKNTTELLNTSELKTLGLFADNGLLREIDRTENFSKPSLYDMSKKAINLLENQTKPYFLMIEGSQIDWASHQNDKYYLSQEVIAFEKVVKYILELSKENSNLQIIITADHETGGLSILNHDFKTEIPQNKDPVELKIEKRYNRTREINVAWTTTGHTSKKVILSGKGNLLENLNKSTHLKDIFTLMYNIIELSNKSNFTNLSLINTNLIVSQNFPMIILPYLILNINSFKEKKYLELLKYLS